MFKDKRKVELWKFLKTIRTILKSIIFVTLWMATIVTIILSWGMVNNADAMIDFLTGEPLYLEVVGNMILIPIKICFVFWIIDICFRFYMRFISDKIDDEDRAKAKIESSPELTKDIRVEILHGDNLWKSNAKEADEVLRQVTILKQWMRTLRINPYIDTPIKIKICNEIREVWRSANACESYFNIRKNENDRESHD